MRCSCGGIAKEIQRADTVHHAELRCSSCNKWLKWVSNPDSKQTGRKGTSKFSIPMERCHFCARTREELGLNETLTIDHSLPLSEGGKDELSNLWVLCTSCHKLKNWHRLYNHTHWEGKRWEKKSREE